MDLTIDKLLELMNESVNNQEYIEYILEETLAGWKTDTNISSTYPVLEWE